MTKCTDEETDFQWQSKSEKTDARRVCCIGDIDDEDPRIRQIRNLAKMQIIMGLLAFIISTVMLAFWPRSAGSSTGTWCTIYIMLFSFMCLGHGGFMRAKFVIPFGVIGMKFAILMVILEVIEIKASFDKTADDNVNGILHITLGAIGLGELVSLILTVLLNTVWKNGRPTNEALAEKTSSEEDQMVDITRVVIEETEVSIPDDEKPTAQKLVNTETKSRSS